MRDDPHGTLFIFNNPDEVAKALAELFVEHAKTSIGARGRFVVALAGGTTPKATYGLLAQAPYCDALDWNAVEIFFGDERCVPPDNEQSNYKMAYEAFIKPLRIPDSNVHRMRGEDDPQQAALDYRRVLLGVLGIEPAFDLVMLGMGPDAHTASLFPGQDPLTQDEERVRAVYSTAHDQWRLTLTPSVLNATHALAFALVGSEKAAALAAVRKGPHDPVTYPAQIIAPPDEAIFVCLVDKAAAVNL